jgi:hypothetical protein
MVLFIVTISISNSGHTVPEKKWDVVTIVEKKSGTR